MYSCSSYKQSGKNFSERQKYYESSDRVHYYDNFQDGDTLYVDKNRSLLRLISLGRNTTNTSSLSVVDGRTIVWTYGEPYEFLDIMLATDTLNALYYNWSLSGCWTDKNVVIELVDKSF